MAHVRKSIRDALVTALTGLATTGARVFAGRVYPLQTAELPGLLVYFDDEEIAVGSSGVRAALERTAELKVEALFKDVASLDDKGDTIAAEVETALGAPGVNLGGAKSARLRHTAVERDGDGEQPAARMTLTFHLFYQTAQGAPSTAL